MKRGKTRSAKESPFLSKKAVRKKKPDDLKCDWELLENKDSKENDLKKDLNSMELLSEDSKNITKENHAKINIISDIIVKNSHTQTEGQTLATMMHRSYLQFTKWAKENNPNLLRNGTCSAILEILKECEEK